MAADRSQRLGAGELESPGPQKVRAFFGLPLPEEQRSALADFLGACAAAAPAFRWTPSANLHLTVRFLGGVDGEVARAIAERVEAQLPHGFEVGLGEIGSFKRGSRSRVVWLGLRTGAEALTQLAAQVETECVAAGLAAEQRPFTAHLTLARARERDGEMLPRLPGLPLLRPWRAAELILYSSHLGRAGATYEPLRAVRLEGG